MRELTLATFYSDRFPGLFCGFSRYWYLKHFLDFLIHYISPWADIFFWLRSGDKRQYGFLVTSRCLLSITFKFIYVNYFNRLRFLAKLSTKLQKMHSSRQFKDHNSGREHGNQTNKPHFPPLLFPLHLFVKLTSEFENSSIVNESIETNSIFLKKRSGWEKAQNNQLPPPPTPPPPSYKILCTKNSCLCCLIFACFYFVNEFLLVLCFCVTKIFLKKIWVCLDSLIYYTTENSQNSFLCGPFWSVKYFIFGQKLPIQTAHHTFLESSNLKIYILIL